MSVVSMVCGASTVDGATFVAKVDGGGPVRVAVADNAAMAGAVFTASQAVDAQGVAKVSIAGLAADGRYHWQVEDNGVLDTTLTGRFRTHPPLGVPGSFSWAVASCAGSNPAVPGVGAVLAPDRLSNHPVFLDIIARDPLGFSHDGDLGYYDLGNGVVGDGSLTSYRRFYDDVLLQPNQHQLYREVAWQYVWDNHDWGRDLTDESDGTLPDAANAQTVYRERVPHYPLTDPAGIYQAWQVARVQFVALDTRSFRSPNADPDGPAKTMLGAAQKTWLQGVLETSTAQFLVLISSSVWHNPPLGADTWESFPTERDELIGLFGDTGWLSRMVIVWGDRHAMGIDSGSNLPGGMAGAQFAPLDDSTPSGGADWFDTGDEGSVPGQYGLLSFTDLGSALIVDIAGWQGNTLWRTHRIGINTGSSAVVGAATVQQFAPIVAGSHEPVFDARLLTTFQSGPDPAGIDLPIVDGDVQYDATASVFATLRLTVQGVDPSTGRHWFPRLHDDPLGPYGNEVFVRRGVDLGGGGILWSPLGFFRIETVEQAGDVDADITITGSDRMAGLVEADVFEPREFPATTQVSSFFAALVGEIYPDATIVFDNDTGLAELGRQVIVDDSRHEPLLEVADGLGKVVFWDGQGLLRVESPPADTVPLWTVAAGRDGVLVEADRRISRLGAPNGVLVIGEGGSSEVPVQGVAIDSGPRSPTRWGGRYGRVLAKERLPTVTTLAQAGAAAREILRRRLGVPHSADFGAVVNPALRPRHPIVVVQRDGNRDRHVVQTLRVPLRTGVHMTGTTKERTAVVIGARIT